MNNIDWVWNGSSYFLTHELIARIFRRGPLLFSDFHPSFNVFPWFFTLSLPFFYSLKFFPPALNFFPQPCIFFPIHNILHSIPHLIPDESSRAYERSFFKSSQRILTKPSWIPQESSRASHESSQVLTSSHPLIRASAHPCVRASPRPCIRASARPRMGEFARPCIRALANPRVYIHGFSPLCIVMNPRDERSRSTSVSPLLSCSWTMPCHTMPGSLTLLPFLSPPYLPYLPYLP